MSDDDIVMPVDITPESVYRKHAESKIAHLDNAAKNIIAINTVGVRKVPETYFYHKLLPIVRNWYKNGRTDAIGLWLNVADGMYNEIAVIDDDDNSELFRLPAAYLRFPAKIIRRADLNDRKPTLADVVDRQAIALENGDTRMAMTIESSILSAVDFDPETLRYFKILSTMVSIYTRYEIPLEDLLGEDADQLAAALAGLFEEKSVVTDDTTTLVVEEPELEPDDYEY